MSDGRGTAGRYETFRLDLQYDGAPFRGWSRQPGQPTIEQALEDAFATVLRERPALTVAGRTDTGVHARRQVVSLRLPADVDAGALVASVNSLTPPEIAVTGLAPAPGFDARRQAVSRSYRYFVWNAGVHSPFHRRNAWFISRALDLDRLAGCADAVVGTHDFTAFTPTETEHAHFRREVLRCRWRRRGPLLWLEIEARTFMRHMVRTLVGTMVEVGDGSRTAEDLRGLLNGAERSRAGQTAPPHGLFLWRIRYY